MLVRDKRIAEIAKSTPRKGVAANGADFTALNVESLKGTLSYFSHLYAKGDISGEAFEALVRQACSIFIENEIKERVQEALERKLLKFWHSKFSLSIEEKYISDIEGTLYGSDMSRLLRSR